MQIEIFNFVLDFAPLILAANKGVFNASWFIFSRGGWILFVYMIITQGYWMWIQRQQRRWFATNKFILLAIDIPKEHEQTPKAVEQLFSTISGAHAPLNKIDLYVSGIFQLTFSFEIVSIDGYVQFLVRTPTQYRDVVESSVYSQYPDAEITEVDDYVGWAPEIYPDDSYNTWSTEVVPVFDQALPIKTYKDFEDQLSGEYKDPLAALLETMSKIQIGEQVWFQILVRPTGFEWPKKSEELAWKLAGKKPAVSPSSRSNKIIDWSTNTIDKIGEFIYPLWQEAKEEKDDMPSLMLHLTPGEKDKIEAIQNKASKMGFECKIRLVYLSPVEQFSPNRVVSSVFGAIKQFAALNLNSFYPDPKTKTSTNYWFTKYRNKKRKTKIIRAYKNRSTSIGFTPFILNTEELATLWHFPGMEIRTPLLKRTETRKGEPPTSLPSATAAEETDSMDSEDLRNQLSMPTKFDVDLDNDYFEDRFAKDRPRTTEATQTVAAQSKTMTPINKGQPPSNLPT